MGPEYKPLEAAGGKQGRRKKKGNLHAGSSMRLIAPLMHAQERCTTNEKPSDDTRVT